MKGEAGSGLKLGTRTKLEQNRAECRRERKGVSSCVFPVPPTHSEEKWSTAFLWKRIFLLKMASKGLRLKPLCALGSLSHTGRLHYVSVTHSHGFPPPPVGFWIPTLDLDIRPFCQAPNLDIQHLFLGSSIQMAHRKFQNWSHLLLHAQPSSCITYVDVRANQDKRLKSSSGSPHPVSSPFLGPISYRWGGLCSPWEAALQLQRLHHLGLISCHHS